MVSVVQTRDCSPASQIIKSDGNRVEYTMKVGKTTFLVTSESAKDAREPMETGLARYLKKCIAGTASM